MKHIVSTLILADDELSRAGLLGILAGARFRPINAKGGWDAIVASGKPPPEIVALILSGTMTDPEATSSKIGLMAKRSKVVVLADHCEAKLVRSAICAGAAAFLPRSISAGVLIQTLDLVLEGEIILPAAVARDMLMCAEHGSERNPGGGGRLLRIDGPRRSAFFTRSRYPQAPRPRRIQQADQPTARYL